MPKIKIDGIEFNTEDLGEKGRAVLASLRFVEGQMQRLRHEIAICRTAQASYVEALKTEVAAVQAGADMDGRE